VNNLCWTYKFIQRFN